MLEIEPRSVPFAVGRVLAVLLAVALTCLSTAASAEPAARWVDLEEGSWRYRALDDGSCASPDLDHSDWEQFALPNPGNPLRDDAVCFRREVSLSGNGPWAVGVGAMIWTRSEVWVDGVRVGGGPAKMLGLPRVFEVPAEQLDDGHAVIAIQTWRRWEYGQGPYPRSEFGPYSIGVRELVEADTEKSRLEYALARLYPSWALLAINVLMTLFFLGLGLRRRELGLYRWFAAVLAVGSLQAFIAAMSRTAMGVEAWALIRDRGEWFPGRSSPCSASSSFGGWWPSAGLVSWRRSRSPTCVGRSCVFSASFGYGAGFPNCCCS